MKTGANRIWVGRLRSAIFKAVAFAVVLLLTKVSFAEKPMPPLGDKHFCEWWQAKVVPAIPRNSAVITGAPLAADSGTSTHNPPMSPGLRAALEKIGAPEPVDPDQVANLNNAVVTAAIGCLLELESDTRPANYSGWASGSQAVDQAPVNLAALYYISYLYTGNWKHANAIALRGPGAETRGSRVK